MNKAKLAAGLSVRTNYNPIKKTAYQKSIEFAYVLGVIYGDGSSNIIEDGHGSSGSTTLGVIDEDFAIAFKKAIEEWSGIISHYNTDGHFFYVKLSSVDASRIIEKFDLKEVLIWDVILQCAFLRGLFDSDGGITGENLEPGKRKYAKRWVHLSNSNPVLIQLTANIFDRLDIRYSIYSRIHSGFGSTKLQYELKIYNFEGILSYYRNINFSITRKRDLLKKVVESYDLYTRNI
ncbi:MAG TPA: LAGLIDADG family homing endonuclease [Candidatus Nanoarchaeia archaeon]|nr:LAGLIDADG family homing endonuclease [Candidatus Nanoarchaeia archaeon]